ncbi:probable indole-3-pyruvate monooxygenase YUCCA10 [Cynara cardunculus var. scolymus]|uniref:probable indole-3-pyruvate monooxygenase YUCCA10 n=1 Tax=Cynara cardunculus var. scolymus TaxID=59895 RepID=UPI000D62F303|nr:probable indole-3-pyruvate monooxygenase YUCCA10 [Cynara cardunculus var. scolymus]
MGQPGSPPRTRSKPVFEFGSLSNLLCCLWSIYVTYHSTTSRSIVRSIATKTTELPSSHVAIFFPFSGGRKTNTGVTETVVIIVGAGPSGLCTAASLHRLSIPYVILEREDCVASLFKNKSYHRFHLHLTKEACQLAHMNFPANFPTYVPRKDFLKYLDDYASHFEIKPMFHNFVKLAKYDEDRKKWKVEVEIVGGEEDGGGRWYEGEFLVVATGETSDPFIPEVDGLSEFRGEVIHSTEYKSGERYENKKVLVVGAGNSGMEIALDLCNHGAKTSIVVPSPIHITPRWSINFGFKLMTHIKFIPWHWVDSFLVLTSKVMYGNLTKYGIQRPKEGPLFLKARYNRYPVIDVGTAKKIKSGEIQVLPGLKSIKSSGTEVVFENGKCYHFDTIMFATGFKRSTHLWLQGGDFLIVKDGFAKPMYPNHWKGENGLYWAGLAKRGLYGSAMDGQNIAQDIFNLVSK